MTPEADERDADGVPGFPALVRAAALLWLGQGAVLLAAGVGLVATAAAPGGPNSRALGVFLLGICPTCLVHGLSLVSGRAAGVNQAGAFSLMVAAGCGMTAAAVAAVAAVTQDSDDRLAACVTGGLAVALAVPALLALAGRRQYLAWRAHHHSGGGA